MANYQILKDFLLFVLFFIFTVLLPGYTFTRLVLPPKNLNKLATVMPGSLRGLVNRYFYYLFAPATGLILLDAVVLLMAKAGQLLSFNNFLLNFSILNIILLALNIWLIKKQKDKKSPDEKNTKKFGLLLALIFLAAVILRMVYYLPNSVPQDTDLGHHMYWSQWMVQKETFPVYDTTEVIEGEHMVFAVLSKLSGVSLLSALPLIVLSFYNLMMVLALSFGALVMTANRKVALWVMFFTGIYFAIDAPQARYVKGGVIGNTFGNLFIALAFILVFLLFRYWLESYLNQDAEGKKKSNPAMASLLSVLIIILAGSLYTHHLSAFLLIITVAASIIVWIIASIIQSKQKYFQRLVELLNFIKNVFLSPKFILTVLITITFPLFIYLPYYLKSKAVETVVRTPSKDTHLGMAFSSFPDKFGWLRFAFFALGIAYLVYLLASYLIKRYELLKKLTVWKYTKKDSLRLSFGILVFAGWLMPLAILTFAPQILKIDLPSRRVVNYLIFPCLLFSAIGAAKFIQWYKLKYSNKAGLIILVLIGLLILWDGTSDFRGIYNSQNKFQSAVELYQASNYLAQNTSANSAMLKDHRTISGDSWIKFFLLRGYDYFLSRTYDYKYSSPDPNSQIDPCTREMIIVPDSTIARRCYGQTGINYVIVKPAGDEFMFWKGKDFNAVYLSDNIAIFSKLE